MSEIVKIQNQVSTRIDNGEKTRNSDSHETYKNIYEWNA